MNEEKLTIEQKAAYLNIASLMLGENISMKKAKMLITAYEYMLEKNDNAKVYELLKEVDKVISTFKN